MPKYRSPEMLQRLCGIEQGLGCRGESRIDLGEDFLEGTGCPTERVSDLVPFGDELVDGALESGEISEVGRAGPLGSRVPDPWLTGFIQEQWTGVKWATNRGWAASQA